MKEGVKLELPAPLPAAAPAPQAPQNVVLVMSDGVRWQEFLGDKPDSFLAEGDKAPTFPRFWSTLAGQGVVFGDAEISNGAELSLPAYESIFAGFKQPCPDNDCARVPVETFPERLKRELGLAAAQVAAVASWPKIELAFSHAAGAVAADAGQGGATRDDAETFPRALDYLRAQKPRFLFISLNDADEWAHKGDYPKYLETLRRYDAWLADLTAALDGLGDYGKNTTLIVTTDHGRGVLWDWKNHGHRPWARRVWLYARGPRVPKNGVRAAGGRHADIRPTVESLLGLAPRACPGCGAVLREIAGP